MAAGFDTLEVARLYNIPLKKLNRKRDIFGKLRNFSDVRRFYKKEIVDKGFPEHEG